MAIQTLPSAPSKPTVTGATEGGGSPRREFLSDLVDNLRVRLPDGLADFRHRPGTSLVKLFYANERVHFEVWIDGGRGHLGLGLHFEDGPVSTAAYLAFFDARIVELKHDLGSGLELERWTASWGHLYEVVPLPRLDAAAVRRTADRLAALIVALQPLVEAAAVPPERSAADAGPRGPWRSRRRGPG